MSTKWAVLVHLGKDKNSFGCTLWPIRNTTLVELFLKYKILKYKFRQLFYMRKYLNLYRTMFGVCLFIVRYYTDKKYFATKKS